MKKLIFGCIIPFLIGTIGAQTAIDGWIPNADYDDATPTYEEFLGYPPGGGLTTHRAAVDYLRILANASNKMTLRVIGETYMGRDLVTAIISSSANLARIDEIRNGIHLLTDARLKGDRNKVINGMPTLVYLAYGVHGNEHSSTEAALLTAYHLLADKSSVTAELLKNTVVIIDPMQNPDGRMRYLLQLESTAALGGNADPNAVEHSPGSISGRTNRYFFDMNRDWFFLTQQETRARVQEVLYWQPQVMVDLHEMGHNASYFFPPPAQAINPNIPRQIRDWWKVFGKGNAEAFDARNWAYYTGEVFDAFYPGYGDFWPTLLGAVGMTYEMSSARGKQIKREDGHIRTLSEAAEHHFVASIATIATASANRKKLLSDFQKMYTDAASKAKSASVKEYILPVDSDHIASLDIADLLSAQGIEVYEAQASFTQSKSAIFGGAKRASRKSFPKGTLIIPTAQPRSILLKTIFDLKPEMETEFVKEEMARQKERLGNRIYDITAWSVPLAYNAEIYTGGNVSNVRKLPYTTKPNLGEASFNGAAAYAFLIPYTSRHAIKAVLQLWREGVKLRISGDSFTQNGRKYNRGTFVILAAENDDNLPQVMIQITENYRVEVIPTKTGWADDGINLGSNLIRYVKEPRILMLYPERPVSSSSYGWMAWMMEQEYELPFTAIWPRQLGSIDLFDYDVVILPDGSGYGSVLNTSTIDKLKSWIRAGGTVVALKGAAAYLTKESLKMSDVRVADDVRPEEQTAKKMKEREKSDEKIPLEYQPKYIPGAIFRAELNKHHYLSYGYTDGVNVLIQSDNVFIPTERGINVATFPKDGGKISGFSWQGAEKQLSEKVFLSEERMGRGHIILFADDPNFRGYLKGLQKLFLNAILLSPSLRR